MKWGEALAESNGGEPQTPGSRMAGEGMMSHGRHHSCRGAGDGHGGDGDDTDGDW